MKHSYQFHHKSKRTFDNLKYADVMKLVDVLDSKSCVGNHVPVRLRPSAYFFIFRKDIMESNRIPVLTSRKMILNHFSRQSGHRHIFSYLEKILWSRTGSNSITLSLSKKKHLHKKFLYIN